MGRNAVDYRQPREGQASCTTPLGPGANPLLLPGIIRTEPSQAYAARAFFRGLRAGGAGTEAGANRSGRFLTSTIVASIRSWYSAAQSVNVDIILSGDG